MSSNSAMTLTVFGLASCDTCRKARKWLDSQHIEYRYHDVRSDGLSPQLLYVWLKSDFAPKLINRQSTTWRQLPEEDKLQADTNAVSLLTNCPTLLKRPVFARGNEILAVGFKPADLLRVLQA